uniref:MATH domain-containing protein n=1 Tax=Arundo donax TaxID=35708 RepID=A0A0A9CYY0_ARUDO
MNNYLDLKLPVQSSTFEVVGHKWYIHMYPLGDQYSTNSLSLFLHLHSPKELPDPESGMMIELTLSILDQKNGEHFSVTGRFVFAVAEKAGWGWSNFIPLTTLKAPSRAYLVGSDCILKADITIIGSSNDG